MKRAPWLVGAVVLLMTGCAAPAANRTPSTPSTQSSAAGASSSVAGTSGVDASPTVSIPSMEFVDVSSFPKGVKVELGSTVARGTYKPFLTGSHITSVAWVPSGQVGSHESALSLELDDAGTAVLERWTASHVGKEMAILLDGRVVAKPEALLPIRGGSVTVSGRGVLAMRSAIDSATVSSRP